MQRQHAAGLKPQVSDLPHNLPHTLIFVLMPYWGQDVPLRCRVKAVPLRCQKSQTVLHTPALARRKCSHGLKSCAPASHPDLP